MKGLLVGCYLGFALRRLMTYMQFFQQEEYDGPRFLRGIFESRRFDRRATILLAVLALAQILASVPDSIVYALSAAVFLVLAIIERDPRRTGKKRLVMTSRAKRTFIVAACLTAGVAVVTALASMLWAWLIAVQILPFVLVAANVVLSPYESRTQKRFWHEAHDKLLSLKPKTIGITGSFGKTSVKHILSHILETQASTLMTPGSVNTAMGIARIVREQLTRHHRFFVCEMGAYGPGSISRLTALAPPDLGVIIAIGQAHFERFKTLDTVARAKFELAEAVVARSGKVVVAEDALEQPSARSFAEGHRSSLVVVGKGTSCDLRMFDVRQESTGIETDVEWKGEKRTLRAPLFGEHQALNVALAFAAACELGVTPENAAIALTSVAQVKHRLEVKRQANGWVEIDDAYNSNPVGFESGLKVMDLFRKPGGRRILLTPGMVELGGAHDGEHQRIGELAAQHVDVLIAIMPERIPTLVSAYRAKRPDGTLLTFPDFNGANQWLNGNITPLDVVLLENDLPDIYEAKLSL